MFRIFFKNSSNTLKTFTSKFSMKFSAPIFKGVKEFKGKFSADLSHDKEIQEQFQSFDSHFKNFYRNDQKNLEILKDSLFRLYLNFNKKVFLKEKSKEISYSEAEKTKLLDIFMQINEKTINPFIENFEEMSQKFERVILDILKNVYVYRLKFPPEIYKNFNVLCDLCAEQTLKNYQKTESFMLKMVIMINICLNRMAICEDQHTKEIFLRVHKLLKENLSISPIEAIISLNIHLKESNFDQYIVEIPLNCIENMFEKNSFEKLALILVRLNKHQINSELAIFIKKNLLQEKNLEKLDSKSLSLLITTNYFHKIIFPKEELDTLYNFLKKLTQKIGFLEASMMVTALHKGKALTPDKLAFFANEIETIIFRLGKLNNRNINDINYHSCLNILNIFANSLSENELKTGLINDLNLLLNFHHLKGITKVEINSIIQGDGVLLKKIRKNETLNQKNKEDCVNNISRLFRKIIPFLNNELKTERFEVLVLYFFAFVQINDESNLNFIENIYSILLERIKDAQKLTNKQILVFYSNCLELAIFKEKTSFEKKYLQNFEPIIENLIVKNLSKFFENYSDALSLLIIVSNNRDSIRNKVIYNEIEEKYLQNIRKFSCLENSYLAFPLEKFALFSAKEIKSIENFYWEQINKEKNPAILEIVLYNLLNCYTQENQFDDEFFNKIEGFLQEKVLNRNDIKLESKLKYFSALGRYEIKKIELIRSYEKLINENLNNLNLFESLNVLNVLLINRIENFDIMNNLLDFIEKNLGKLEADSVYFEKYLTLAKIIVLNIKYEYSSKKLDDFPKLLAFAELKRDNRNQIANNRSYFQKNMKGILQELKIDFVEEKMVGPFVIDFFIEPNICFEINGKSHYVNEKKLNVNTERKYRILKKMEYKIKTISPGEWNKIENESNKSLLIKDKILEI